MHFLTLPSYRVMKKNWNCNLQKKYVLKLTRLILPLSLLTFISLLGKSAGSCSFSGESLLTSFSSHPVETHWMIPRANKVLSWVFFSVLGKFYKLCSNFYSWKTTCQKSGKTENVFGKRIGRIVLLTRNTRLLNGCIVLLLNLKIAKFYDWSNYTNQINNEINDNRTCFVVSRNEV